jgi:flagellar motor protein MotB
VRASGSCATGNYIEIEGHTDSTGSTELNERLGLARAENVKRVISFGESKPRPTTRKTDARRTGVLSSKCSRQVVFGLQFLVFSL